MQINLRSLSLTESRQIEEANMSEQKQIKRSERAAASRLLSGNEIASHRLNNNNTTTRISLIMLLMLAGLSLGLAEAQEAAIDGTTTGTIPTTTTTLSADAGRAKEAMIEPERSPALASASASPSTIIAIEPRRDEDGENVLFEEEKTLLDPGRQPQFRALKNWSKPIKLSSKILHPNQRNNNNNNTNNKKAKLEPQQAGGGDTLSGANSSTSNRTTTPAGQQKGSLPKANSKRLNSMVLKKLLNQALPKLNNVMSNESSLASSDGATKSAPTTAGNFKLVFIQRATAAPSGARDAKLLPAESDRLSTDNSHSKIYSDQSNQTKPQAGSVSRQLASSLLNSAISLAATARGSSLFTTASSRSSGFTSTTERSVAVDDSKSHPQKSAAERKSTEKSDQPATSNDIQPAIKLIVNSAQRAKQNPATNKSRPSKIYHLPLKFVSNGQPNSVVLSAIRQHFSMMKKIQEAALSMSSANQSNQPMPHRLATGLQGNKTKKNHSIKLKGANSRLIYLPLKYLSNARPSMLQVIATRASHKSLTSISSHRH